MKLTHFTIRNFKNLDNLSFDVGDLTGIMGANNRGKTNVLQALKLFFQAAKPAGNSPLWQGRSVSDKECPADNFPSGNPSASIYLRASFEGADIGVRITRENNGACGLQYDRFMWKGKDLVKKPQETEEEAKFRQAKGIASPEYARRVALTAEEYEDILKLFQTAGGDRLDFIDVFRSMTGKDNRIRVGGQQFGVQDALAEMAFSMEPDRFIRWHLFKHAMEAFTQVAGDGRWEILWDRVRNSARLAFESGDGKRVLAENLGTGLRSIATLVARVALFSGDIALVDEPEQNISPALWKQVGEFLKQAGVKQIITATHSKEIQELCDVRVEMA